ncbi:hypothetical protein HYPSUDRAFT_203444 [Hypholoma sublateritium FD-334 SS-4]|uniref:Uncharacterized protein n=1 Tax=Hypholoma sublateritium (strain FD-334 SS-4) TaxID=945553 RepID=A0A0D2NWI2_HYPSF|nr:hypothetical protein HYPSUDRAFT_203444 [Hypholoma sublateritium FD-334 SS-4]
MPHEAGPATSSRLSAARRHRGGELLCGACAATRSAAEARIYTAPLVAGVPPRTVRRTAPRVDSARAAHLSQPTRRSSLGRCPPRVLEAPGNNVTYGKRVAQAQAQRNRLARGLPSPVAQPLPLPSSARRNCPASSRIRAHIIMRLICVRRDARSLQFELHHGFTLTTGVHGAICA